MPDFQIKKNPKDYDVCIVESDAGGGMAAYVLANARIKVVFPVPSGLLSSAIRSSDLTLFEYAVFSLAQLLTIIDCELKAADLVNKFEIVIA